MPSKLSWMLGKLEALQIWRATLSLVECASIRFQRFILENWTKLRDTSKTLWSNHYQRISTTTILFFQQVRIFTLEKLYFYFKHRTKDPCKRVILFSVALGPFFSCWLLKCNLNTFMVFYKYTHIFSSSGHKWKEDPCSTIYFLM